MSAAITRERRNRNALVLTCWLKKGRKPLEEEHGLKALVFALVAFDVGQVVDVDLDLGFLGWIGH